MSRRKSITSRVPGPLEVRIINHALSVDDIDVSDDDIQFTFSCGIANTSSCRISVIFKVILFDVNFFSGETPRINTLLQFFHREKNIEISEQRDVVLTKVINNRSMVVTDKAFAVSDTEEDVASLGYRIIVLFTEKESDSENEE